MTIRDSTLPQLLPLSHGGSEPKILIRFSFNVSTTTDSMAATANMLLTIVMAITKHPCVQFAETVAFPLALHQLYPQRVDELAVDVMT